MSSSDKIKILLVGSVGDQVDVLQKKLDSLQTSKAGPFDACFCVGNIQIKDFSTLSFPLPVYLQEYAGTVPSTNDNKEDDGTFATGSGSGSGSDGDGDGGGIVKLGTNLFYLQGGDSSKHDDHQSRNNHYQLLEIKLPNHEHELVVGCCSKHVRMEDSTTTTTTTTTTSSTPTDQQEQTQCDILLSSDWPQGMEDVVNVDTEPLSFDVAQVALKCRPRYHVAPSSLRYHQSPPYRLPLSDHVGRFLALAPVMDGKTTKSTKFIHALGVTPLSANPPPTTAPSTLPCPFGSSFGNTSGPYLNGSDGHISHQRTKPVPGFVAAAHANDTGGGYSRFATNKKRSRGDGDDGRHSNEQQQQQSVSLEPPDDPSIKTLFLHGLHKDVTGRLQSTTDTDNTNHKVFQAFASYGITQVRYPPNAGATSTYCFLEFPNQKAALSCLLDCQGRKTIDSVDLTVKWATPNNNNNANNNYNYNYKRNKSSEQKHYVTEAEAPDSITLYFHPPHEKENDDEFANALCQYLKDTLEEALNEGNEEDPVHRVTAETEPALNVSVRNKGQYGFLEFASHAAATMALAAVTKRTDGGLIQEVTTETKPAQPKHLIGTTLRWAKGEPPKSKKQETLEALGLERQFFPADNRTDCWFCLASPTCETHLITGVYKEWYAAMPKGPVHPGHVLLIPVTHTNQGAWTLSSEWTQLLDQMAEHASQAYDCDLFVFERAMETKGGYHSHVNCVPIPRTNDTVMQLQTTMMAHAKASGFNLRHIQSDLSVDALIKGNEDSPYFYAEIRTKRQSHRFLYQSNNNDDGGGSGNRSSVPLQFAREVLAAVLENPKLAHWKSCVVDKEQETQLAKDFRESFAKIVSEKQS